LGKVCDQWEILFLPDFPGFGDLFHYLSVFAHVELVDTGFSFPVGLFVLPQTWLGNAQCFP
jgi:hypothetical protein